MGFDFCFLLKIVWQCCLECGFNNMFLLLVLMVLGGIVAEELVEDVPTPPVPPLCNCSRVLQGEEVTTDPPLSFPMTSFTCWGRYDGYYADVEVDCTIFHYCQTWYYPTGLNETVKWDFACPQSTIFNQKILSCTPPNISFDCQESPNYYWVNYNFTSTSTTATPSPTSEYSTPHSNLGQQLIVGGLGPQSAGLEDSTVSASEQTENIYLEQSPSVPSPEQSPNASYSEIPPGTSFSEQPSSVSHPQPPISYPEQSPSVSYPEQPSSNSSPEESLPEQSSSVSNPEQQTSISQSEQPPSVSNSEQPDGVSHSEQSYTVSNSQPSSITSYSEQPPSISHSEQHPSTPYSENPTHPELPSDLSPEQPPSISYSQLPPIVSYPEQPPNPSHSLDTEPPTDFAATEPQSGSNHPLGDVSDGNASDIITFPN